MKIRDKYKVLNYAFDDYNRTFNHNYQRRKFSKRLLLDLLKENKHSSMCEWSYCCYGLYQNCWVDPYEEGIWHLTQKDVDKILHDTICELSKTCKRDGRLGIYKEKDVTHVIVIARDLAKHNRDYLFTFSNKEL